MKITTIGRGTISGMLARLWTSAGHESIVQDGGAGLLFYRFTAPQNL
jgi:hypothetical protein